MPHSILVVEDDQNMRELLVEFLEDEGYHAHGAPSNAVALSLVETILFDLVITDVRMAGVDGVHGFSLLKERLPELRCIVITGYADLDVSARAIEIEVDDYLQKPFKLDDLLAVVKRVLSTNRLARYYHDLVQEGPTKLLAAAARFFKKDAGEAVDQARSRAFQGFYVAIRSDLIPVNTANGLFSKLLELDGEYKDFLATPQAPAARELEAAYGELFEFLTALARSRTQMIGGERMAASEFRPLYEAVRNGAITPEQLQLAPTLRQVTASDLVASPELLRLRETLWGFAS